MSGRIERFFEHLSARDWASLRDDLAPDVERVGPLGDRVAGRDRYVAMLEGAVPADYGNDVHRVTYADDGRAAFARVTEHLGYPDGALHLEEAYAFGLDGEGLVTRIEVTGRRRRRLRRFWSKKSQVPNLFGRVSDEKVRPSPEGRTESRGLRPAGGFDCSLLKRP